MNNEMRIGRFALLGVIMGLLLGGCATGPKIDWKARVGNFTYDQAVIELGVPDKSAKLGDGTVVAEWLLHTYYSGNWGFAGGVYVGHGYWMEPGISSAYPGGVYSGLWLRLTFGPDGKLRAWKKYER